MEDKSGTTAWRVQHRVLNLDPLFMFAQRSMAHRFIVAVLVVILAWFVREAIGPPSLGVPFLTFFPAAAISAFLGGFWSGMFAAMLGASLATYYYIPPYEDISFNFHSSTIFGNLVYLLDELIVCAAMATLHRYHLRARAQYAEMHTLIQTIPEMIWLKNPDGIYLKCNSAFERLLGKPQDEIIGKSDRELFGDDVARELRAKDLDAISASEPLTDEVWVPSVELDQPILRETIKAAMRTDDGRLIGVLGIGRDITERRKMEKALSQHQRELEGLVTERTSQVRLLNSELEALVVKAVAASQAKSSFLANMSHEIRTPLNALLGFAHLLDTTRLDAEQQDFVHKVQGAGRALLGIINDVLDFSKIEAGRMELHHATFHLNGMLEDLSALMTGNVGNKGIELIISLDPGLPDKLQGDAMRLLQVLTNLVGNAIKFTDHGHVALRVQGLERQVSRTVLRFVIQDTGIGIAPEVLERLFMPFAQADVSTTRRFGGTGLGLAITRRLVELMGGELGASSTPGVGSEFWVNIPLDIVDTPQQAVQKTTPPIKVLIADDHDLQREVLTATAQTLGWQAEAVASGEAVLARTRELHTFDILLLDWKMPGLDGLATSSALLADPDCPESPIILMVTAHDQETLRQAPEVGAIDGILAKPVTPSALFNAFLHAKAKRAEWCDDLVAKGRSDHQEQRLFGIRILVVDDSDINLDVARRILELEGAEVTTARHGQESLAILRTHPEAFDVVLMDVQMPIMDGNEVVRIIRQEPQWTSLPIIALTAGALDSERQRALAAGMSDFIAKPFDVEKMMRTIRTLVEQTRPLATPPVTCAAPPVTSAAWPEIAGIDLRDVYLRLGDNWPLFLSLLTRLLDEFLTIAQDVEQDLLAQKTTQAAMRLHKLRGSAGNTGAKAIHRMAGELETLLRAHPDEDITNRLPLLDAALQKLARAAAPHLAPPATPAPDHGVASPRAEAIPPADQAAIDALLTALEQQNCAATSLFEALAPTLSAHLGAAELDQLTHAINSLSFDEALKQLATLKKP
ncbi:MAG: response regulator [Magnetococcales bacterium]|nr:response regulator [Magnetococcales bacterium]